MNRALESLKTAFRAAWRSLRLNLLRTSLTVLGVVIGVASIIIVFAAGDGVQGLVYGEIESYGTNIIETEIKSPNNVAGSAEVTTLKLSDMEAIDRLSNVSASYAASMAQQRVAYGSESKKTFIMGVSAAYADIDSKSKLAAGTFFSEGDDDSQSLVIVLGSSLKETLFGDQEAVGKTVKVGGKNFRVVGVLAEQGGASFMDFDAAGYIPIKTLHKRILGIDYAMYFIHQIKDVDRAEETAEEIRALMRERHDISDENKEDFRVSTMAEMMDILGTVTGAITYLLLAIVLISLLVGGVGIMNIMYVTVVERTPEIGLRKALGATGRDIAWQFLIESLLISFWGWFLGSIFGIIASWGLAAVARAYGLAWDFSFPSAGIGLSLLFSTICGLVFGFRPARSASRLDPVEALRVE